ncbi:hypothetical protein [Aureimonas sp. AU20]|uniref:hypothetical protein n=1 Tax=Aureimonas sp. AU20 TaxID=1349819 RepID=UPI00071FBCE5|nr:hypothetical protein [Aureimonas sp. AU20]ALN74174.1 hypothetical protein M673_15710 [Aureimonas sp. AU20]
MRTRSIERARSRTASGLLAKLSLWISSVRQRLAQHVCVLQEEEMPDWLKRDIGWRDGPADAPRAVVEGWSRPPATRPRKSA